MGKKGVTRGPGAEPAAEAFVADLSPLGDVTSRSMFGGFGIFCEGVMFGLVDSAGVCFLRISDPAESRLGDRHGRMPYAAVPAGLRDDELMLVEVARSSLAASLAAKR